MVSLVTRLIPIVLFFMPTSLIGQEDNKKELARRLKDPTGTSPVDMEGLLFTLKSQQSKETAGLRLATEILFSKGEKAILGNLNLSFSGPLDKQGEPVKLANFDGFTNTTAVEIGGSFLLEPLYDSKVERKILNAYLSPVIEKEARDFLDQPNQETSMEDLNKIRETLEKIDKLREKKEAGVNESKNPYKETNSDIVELIIENINSFFEHIDSSNDLPELARNKYDSETEKRRTTSWAASITYKTGEESFNYVPGFPDMEGDPAAMQDPFEMMNESKRNEAVTGSVGYLLQRFVGGQVNSLRPSYIGLNIKYQRSHKANAPTDFCRDVENAEGVSICSQAIFGPPQEKEELIFQLEGRFLTKNLGFHPKATWNEKESEVNYELPIYFIRNEKGLLTGGASLEYLDADHEFRLNVFVGTPFRINL